MKKIIFLLMLTIGCCLAMPEQTVAQTEQKTKVKKTTTVGQKVTNTFRKKHRKRYDGVKAKTKIEKPSVGTSNK